ncbi:MAG: 4'-phosphopantetheinyl transferase superfamily protein, partial [Bacteroidales bacterium]|nr:4'-phosphopantetheinyl transferase superfamily protein [Bacteroidales bacterium]
QEQYYQLNPHRCFPLSFCCKEAVFKALGDSCFTSSIDWKDIRLVFDSEDLKNAHVELSGVAKEVFESLNGNQLEIDYSIMGNHAMFQVFIHGDNA